MDKNQSHEDKLNSFFDVLSSELSQKYGRSVEKRAAVERMAGRCRKRAAYVRPNLTDIAISKFVEINSQVAKVSIDLDGQVVADARHFIQVTLERFTTSNYPYEIQNPLSTEFLYDHWRFGPGSSNGVKGTHTADKIVQKMTCTALCEPFVSSLRMRNAYLSAYDCRNGLGISVIEGSRMTTVPKNEDTVRTIATEPSGNLAMQLAAGEYLEGALRMIGLDITRQEAKNKRLARIGSVTNRLATIDLSAASDRFSIDLVRLLMPSVWFELLMKIRSPCTELPDGTVLEMAMISTMGNGFTFPLMTLLITALIYGFRAQRRGSPSLYIDWTFTAVYGDDIIVPAHEFEGICEILRQAGLVVNADKSYSDGPFRESCGGDYYSGYDVTPVYIKSLHTNADVYVAMNQILLWCARHEIVLHLTLLYLKSLVGRPFLVPEWMNPNQGVLTARVARRFKYLSVVPLVRKYVHADFAVMLACGGYLTPRGSDNVYSPRVERPKMSVRQSRLLQGYLDGWCAERYTKTESLFISMILDILM